MATPRTQQAHQKRVQKIVADAAEQIAADSPVEEEVVVSVEELPPGESSSRTRSPRAKAGAEDLTGKMLQSAAKSQQFAADGINAWIDFTKKAFGTGDLSLFTDPRAKVEGGFRFAEELLTVQKDFALRVAELMPGGK